jgi:hypothetical protein
MRKSRKREIASLNIQPRLACSFVEPAEPVAHAPRRVYDAPERKSVVPRCRVEQNNRAVVKVAGNFLKCVSLA